MLDLSGTKCVVYQFMKTPLLVPALLVLAAVAVGLLILAALDTGTPPMKAAVGDGPAPAFAGESLSPDLGNEVTMVSVSGNASSAGGQTGNTAAAFEAATAGDNTPREQILEVIEDATTTYDVEGLTVLGPLLKNPDPEIREATIEGIIQLGETAGAKILREAARQAKDPREARRMIEAAAFLELPEYGSSSP